MNDIKLINCEDALARLFDYLDHELDGHRQAEMEQHLKICRSCYSRADFETRLKTKLSGVGVERPPAELDSRIRKLLGNF